METQCGRKQHNIFIYVLLQEPTYNLKLFILTGTHLSKMKTPILSGTNLLQTMRTPILSHQPIANESSIADNQEANPLKNQPIIYNEDTNPQ
jgi:hypothetical protein